jgi:hypothetical protein
MRVDEAALDAATAHMSDHRSDNATRASPQERPRTKPPDHLQPLHRWLPMFPMSGPCSLCTLVVQHQGERRVNPDASRSLAGPENAAIVGRAPVVLAGCSGTAFRPRAATPDERANRTHRRSRFGRGRSGCRYARVCRNGRRERAGLSRASSVENRPASHRQTSRCGAILHLHCARHGGGTASGYDLQVCPGVVPVFSRPNRLQFRGIGMTPRRERDCSASYLGAASL